MTAIAPQLTREQVEGAVRRLFDEKILNRGGIQPSAEAVEIAVKLLVNQTMREIAAQRSSPSSGLLDVPLRP